ncbi:hypothetical protein [Mucilaginibacter sp.]|uniref:hypothetical protein n=1 Tax=Mucilaginibacter sp. TaxID=1882438 RepID=UPI003AFFFBD0
MGKDLHPTILPFIKDKIEFHQDVISVTDISTNEHYMFRITRRNGMRDIVVLLDDGYHFSEFDYYSKPSDLNEGGFILIARPESTISDYLRQHEPADKIIIGKLGILLGALRKDEFWTYEKPIPKAKDSR